MLYAISIEHVARYALAAVRPMFNISRRKVGGIWFVKLGRLNVSFCVSRRYA